MCLSKLFGGFKPVLIIPHPEEPRDPLATVDNINLPDIVKKWLEDWKVPSEYLDFWEAWPIVLVPSLTYMGQEYPALTWPDRTDVDPHWVNPGILAHELCHVVWAGLSEDQRFAFSAAYQVCLGTSPLLHKLFTEKPYMQQTFGKDDNREGHADTYRYLGGSMPPILKTYYPKLF